MSHESMAYSTDRVWQAVGENNEVFFDNLTIFEAETELCRLLNEEEDVWLVNKGQ